MGKWWSILFGVVMLACLGLFIVAPFVGWWLPLDASTHGWEIDFLFYLILWITGFFFVLTEALLVVFMWQYAGKPGQPGHVFGHHAEETKGAFWTSFFKKMFRPVSRVLHNQHRVELAWTLVPGVILLVIAFAQVKAWADIKYTSRMPRFDVEKAKPLQIEVSARQFEWRIRYPSPDRLKSWYLKPDQEGYEDPRLFARNPHVDDVYVVNELHCWKDNPVLVQLRSRDVLHSFFIPQMRIKQDALPGKIIPVWFTPTQHNTLYNKKSGRWDDGHNPTTKKHDKAYVWDLACAELCGWGHYKMLGKLYVHENPESFTRWLTGAYHAQHKATTMEALKPPQ